MQPNSRKQGRWTLWSYVLAVVLIGLSIGINPPTDASLRITLTLVLLAVLTYPLGVLGTASCLALIYPGIATPAEAVVVCTPIFAAAGLFQWKVVFPRLVRNAAAKASLSHATQGDGTQ